MSDQQFLQWLHTRLVNIHDENPNSDYMHRLRAIAAALPPEQHTPNVASAATPPVQAAD